MSLSVIIPSKDLRNLLPCIEAVRENDPHVNVVVVDDGLGIPSMLGVQWITGMKPFVYARNVNLGIMAVGTDDVVLLNDDALLRTFRGFHNLQKEAQLHPEFGVIGSTCNNVGNLNQLPRGVGLREDPRMVCFVCALIPRRTINIIGLLDERFISYGWEDNDYCRRARIAGMKIGIFDGCYVDHGSLRSTFRGGPERGGDIGPNMLLYLDKWHSID